MTRLRPLLFPALAALALATPVQGGPAAQGGLNVDCRGLPTASPTVILESGAFGAAADWDLVLDDLAKGGRACAYDRGGIGRSPDRPGARDATAIARELKTLLDQIGETEPVILVGHSNGALYAETFAALWPERVAGLAYVNGVTSDDLDYPLLIADLDNERRLSKLAAFAGHIGLSGIVSSAIAQGTGLGGEAGRRKREALDDPHVLNAASEEDAAVVPSLSETRRLGGSPPALPTAAIGGSSGPQTPLIKAWREAEAVPARRAQVGRVFEIPDATHTSPLSRDRGYVVEAVDWLRAAARQGGPPGPG